MLKEMKENKVFTVEGAELRQRILTPVTAIKEYLEELNQIKSFSNLGLSDEIQRISSSCELLISKSSSLMNDVKELQKDSNPDLSTFRHDLRNPLNGIVGYTEIILEEFEKELEDLPNKILTEIKGLTNEIGEAIDSIISMLEAGLTDSDDAQKDEGEETQAIERLFQSLEQDEYVARIDNAIKGKKILIVDDNKSNIDLLQRRLSNLDFNCLTARGGKRALEIMKEESVDLVLLDVLMPDMNGLEVLNELRKEERWTDLPVIMVSGFDDVRSVAKCIALGASDYLSKPVDKTILTAKVVAALERKVLRNKTKELMEELTIQATTDQLTGLINRRSLMKILDESLQTFNTKNSHFGLIGIDIDFFKKVNDTYGHSVGDLVLVEAASCLKRNVRTEDVVGRMGGEEFLAIITDCTVEEVTSIAERVRKEVENLSIKVDDIELKITISGGTAHSSEKGNVDELINLADERLYIAKENGRNQIIKTDN